MHANNRPTGIALATTGDAPQTNSVPALLPMPEIRVLAATAASDLVDLLPPQDFPDPKKVMAAIAAILANYHQRVIAAAPLAIAKRTDRLTLKIVTEVCDELQAPISRALRRADVLALPSPCGPANEVRDAQVADYERRIRPLITAALQPVLPARVEPVPDGKHYGRIKADLDRRRAIREARDELSNETAA